MHLHIHVMSQLSLQTPFCPFNDSNRMIFHCGYTIQIITNLDKINSVYFSVAHIDLGPESIQIQGLTVVYITRYRIL